MTSILNLETSAAPEVEPLEVPEQSPAQEPSGETSEYEIVLGRAQIASWLFVGVIAVVVCASLAYLAGETTAGRKTARAATTATSVIPAPAASAAPASSQALVPTSTPTALPAVSILVPPTTDLTAIVKTAGKSTAPLLADPEMGKVYLQIGAVERGMARVLAEGLRSHGFDSFVAPGPNEKVFRVLIGPLPDPQAFRQAMVAVDALDLANFARKYQK